MKKIFFIALLFVFANSKAQVTPPCWWTPEWEWLNPTPQNWVAYTGTTGNSIGMGSPFYDQVGNSDIYNIQQGEDYKKEQGWVLLAKDFGCQFVQVSGDMPWFMLYNRYTGLTRLFVYNESSNSATSGLVTCEWNNLGQNTSLLNYSNNSLNQNNVYPKVSNTEQHANYVNEYSAFGGWFVVEIETFFDPKTSDINPNLDLKFSVFACNTSTVRLNGTFQFETKTATIKEPQTVTKTPNAAQQILEWITSGQKFLGKAGTREDMEKTLNSIRADSTYIADNLKGTFANKLENLIGQLLNGDLRKYLIGAASLSTSAGSALKILAQVTSFFTGKANTAVANSTSNYIQPMISNGNLALTGSIEQQLFAKNIFLQVPGSKHKDASGTVSNFNAVPYYDCPLGVTSVEELPLLSSNVNSIVPGTIAYRCTTDFYSNQQPIIGGGMPFLYDSYLGYSVPPTSPSNQAMYHYQKFGSLCEKIFPAVNFQTYIVSGDLKLALNEAAGLTLESVQAALVAEIPSIADYNLYQDSHPDLTPAEAGCSTVCPSPPSGYAAFVTNNNSKSNSQIWYNPPLDAIKSGVLDITNPNLDGKILVSTQLVALDKFKNTKLVVPQGSTIYLKLLCTFRPIDPSADQTPVVITQTYNYPSNRVQNTTAVNWNFPKYTCDQLGDMNLANNSGGFATTSGVNNIYNGGSGVLVVKNPVPQNASGIIVTNLGYSAIAVTPNNNMDYVADHQIIMEPNFKALAVGTGSFTARIAPTGACLEGENSLIVNSYFASCNPNPLTNRLAGGRYSKPLAEAPVNIQDKQIKISLVPNPASESVKILISKQLVNPTIRLTNTLGTVVFLEKTQAVSDVFELITLNLQSGMYVLTIYDNEKSYSEKLIISK